MTTDEHYMYRCLQLAKLGAGHVAPNPMVGAVLVHDDRIIGEGYHQKYGEAHAEVNCIYQAMSNGQADKISQATLYVSLEPCVHFGRTPPCTDLIIKHKIPKVVIGCRDPFIEVNGKGIEKLKAEGIEVVTGVSENECKELNKRFFVFNTQHRPYFILKWAETADGFIALPPKVAIRGTANSKMFFEVEDSKTPPSDGLGQARLHISNEYTNRLVHKWRSEEAAILVGTNTVENDDPELTTRLWPGNSPIRLVVDMHLRLSSSLKVFNRQERTIIFNTIKHEEDDKLMYYQVTTDTNLVHQITNALYQLKTQSVIVEGGAKLLQSFIDEEMWDEARVIRNGQLAPGKGLKAPTLRNVSLQTELNILSDAIKIYKPAL